MIELLIIMGLIYLYRYLHAEVGEWLRERDRRRW